MFVNAMSVPILFALVPATSLGPLIAFGSMLIGGFLIECAIKILCKHLVPNGKVNVISVFLSHIPLSLGTGLCVFLSTIPWALTISAVVAVVYVLGVRLLIDGSSMNAKDFMLLVSPINKLSIWILSWPIHVGLIVFLTFILQLVVYACVLFSFPQE